METRSNHILVGGVMLVLLAGLVAFLIWVSGLGAGQTKDYDIFFKQSVEGLAKGSSVSFSGVPSGLVKEIKLWKENPEFVRVRISVNDELPVLVGTTASIGSTSFTGPSQIQLEGAVKGAPPISEPGPGPGNVPTIPTKTTGLGALLNNAPKLIERLSTLTERLTEIMSDDNQKYFTGILRNVDNASATFAQSAPDLRATLAETRLAIRQAGSAAQAAGRTADSFGAVAQNGNALLNNEARPMISDLRKTLASTQKSLDGLDALMREAKPGVTALTTQTVPEVSQLMRDLRSTSEALGSVATKIDQQGAGALIGGPKLPDYEPGKRGK